MRKVLFIDRDGTLVEEPPDEQIDSLEKVRLVPGVVQNLLALRDDGYRFVMVSNQDGLGTAAFPAEAFESCQDHILALFVSQGIEFDEVFICPHLPADQCGCRKPRTGLLTRYLAAVSLDTAASAVIGDRDSDMQLAHALGIRGLKVGAEADRLSWDDIRRCLTAGQRTATETRATNETRIEVSINLDEVGPVSATTGIGFFDHMLEQIGQHGGFSLQVNCDGDLSVDEHHTIEDTALVIGTAIRKALGNKRGIARFGFLLPMDESEAQVSIDLSGRPYLVFVADFPRERVGQMPTELVEHFFRSLSDAMAATLHISVAGENAHHMVEACFKALGRSLRQAIRRDGNEMPSTKGVLN
jgi:imidazoleglycerol-phosphate dehydratase/histidinol-phosphatase